MDQLCKKVKCLHTGRERDGWYCAVQRDKPSLLPCALCRTDHTKKYMARVVVMVSYALEALPEKDDPHWPLVQREIKQSRAVLQHRYLMAAVLCEALNTTSEAERKK